MKRSKLVNELLYKSQLHLKRSSPTILTGIGAIGVVVTSIMAVKATPKALKFLEMATNDKGEELTKLEVIQVAGPAYIPALVMCLSTISCILGANVLNKQKQTSLASAYAMLDQSFKYYRKAAVSVYGDDADSKIKIEMTKEKYISADGYFLYNQELDSSEKELFYDMYSQRYFTSTMAAVINAQYHFNRNFILRGNAMLNEFYEFVGLDKTDYGETVGWDYGKMIESGIEWLDFENSFVKMDDGLECYVISTIYEPTVLGYEI